MGEIVARQFERVRLVAGRDESQLAVAFKGPADVAQLPIHPRRDRGLGEAGPDRSGDVGRRRARGHLTD